MNDSREVSSTFLQILLRVLPMSSTTVQKPKSINIFFDLGAFLDFLLRTVPSLNFLRRPIPGKLIQAIDQIWMNFPEIGVGETCGWVFRDFPIRVKKFEKFCVKNFETNRWWKITHRICFVFLNFFLFKKFFRKSCWITLIIGMMSHQMSNVSFRVGDFNSFEESWSSPPENWKKIFNSEEIGILWN